MDNDLISRATLLEIVGSMSTAWEYGQAVIDIYEIIKKQPAVDAAPVVHARQVWINPLKPGAKICTWKCTRLCSACGDYVAVSWKCCPNCGARMDGGEGVDVGEKASAD